MCSALLILTLALSLAFFVNGFFWKKKIKLNKIVMCHPRTMARSSQSHTLFYRLSQRHNKFLGFIIFYFTLFFLFYFCWSQFAFLREKKKCKSSSRMFTDDNCLKIFGTSVNATAEALLLVLGFWDSHSFARANTTFKLMSSSYEKEKFIFIYQYANMCIH